MKGAGTWGLSMGSVLISDLTNFWAMGGGMLRSCRPPWNPWKPPWPPWCPPRPPWWPPLPPWWPPCPPWLTPCPPWFRGSWVV